MYPPAMMTSASDRTAHASLVPGSIINSAEQTFDLSVPKVLQGLAGLIKWRRDEIIDYLTGHPDIATLLISIKELCGQLTPLPGSWTLGDVKSEINSDPASPNRSQTTPYNPTGPEATRVKRRRSTPGTRIPSIVVKKMRVAMPSTPASVHESVQRKSRYTKSDEAASAFISNIATMEPIRINRVYLAEARQKAYAGTQEQLNSCAASTSENGEDIAKRRRTDKRSCNILESNKHLQTVTNRYRGVLDLPLYKSLLAERNGESSPYELFLRATMREWWVKWKNKEHESEEKKMKAIQAKCKAVVNSSGLWAMLSNEFGCGILALIPENFTNEDARLVINEKKEQLCQRLATAYPNLKRDLADLTTLISQVVERGTLPERFLRVETMNDVEFSNMKGVNLREIFSFVDDCSPTNALDTLTQESTQDCIPGSVLGEDDGGLAFYDLPPEERQSGFTEFIDPRQCQLG